MIYQSMPSIQMSNALPSFLGGEQLGEQQAATNQLGQLSAQSYGMIDPAQQNTLLSTMARIDPAMAQKQQAIFGAMNANQQAQAKAHVAQLGQNAAAIAAMPDGPQKDSAWQRQPPRAALIVDKSSSIFSSMRTRRCSTLSIRPSSLPIVRCTSEYGLMVSISNSS